MNFVKYVKEVQRITKQEAATESDYVDENEDSVSGWRILWGVLIFILIIIRIVVRCLNHFIIKQVTKKYF